MNQAMITLGGGCFWCLEGVYSNMRGIISALSGYMGGAHPNPSYEAVCTGTTGHAEVVQLGYDTTQTNLNDILQVFFSIHDATTLNRQGNDIGTQYRSVIYYHDETQKNIASQTIVALQTQLTQPVVTELSPASTFYPAEDYHQNYFAHHPQQGYCRAVVAPKIAKFAHYFPQWVNSRA
ncbi:MAG: peptide-methionine (S)-S-oxide reductase MsrA [Sulfuriferula sp.]|nr:peptide-methionine (S)-S-oxide reductase MsrA [Sulfuriferula sp.]